MDLIQKKRYIILKHFDITHRQKQQGDSRNRFVWNDRVLRLRSLFPYLLKQKAAFLFVSFPTI